MAKATELNWTDDGKWDFRSLQGTIYPPYVAAIINLWVLETNLSIKKHYKEKMSKLVTSIQEVLSIT